MAEDFKSVVLIATPGEQADRLGETLRELPSVSLEEHKATLTEMNGQAVKLAGAHDLVVFRTDHARERDLAAIRALRAQADPAAVILAITPADTSLAEAGELTRAGVDDVLPDTLTRDELETRLTHWAKSARATSIEVSETAQSLGKLISVAQARGGIGATTLAANLADQIARPSRRRKAPGNRVVLVDLDLQFGGVGSFLDLEPNEALFQLASNGGKIDGTWLDAALVEKTPGLFVLTAPARPMPLDALTRDQVDRLMGALRRRFDYVVVDLPRALVEWLAPVLKQSDRMLLVTDTAVPSIHQARRLIDSFTEDNLGLSINVVINHEKKPMIRGRHHTEASKVLERTFDSWIPHDPKPAREAVDRGVPLSSIAARAPMTRAIRALAQQLVADLDRSDQVAATDTKYH
ncbi:AAA family ATPase [Aliiroseovarius sp.]|uniref:AAA family ATPase n=1 Tax=Aliiroseovarius sp. TaxID=1872442 RepID=UPI0026335089|nr:AAA family ATPase [Aliiroseovarius sp.]